MKKRNSGLWLMIGVFGLLGGFSGPGFAQDQDRTRDRDLIRLKEQIHKETNLSQQELDSLGPEFKTFLERKRDQDQIRAMIRVSLENDCRGTCLREMLRTMNQAISEGVPEKEARGMVSVALREQIREREQEHIRLTDDELGKKVREEVQERLVKRNREMEREHMELEQREMQREMGSERGGSGMKDTMKGGKP